MSRKPKAAVRALIGIPMVVLALSAGSSAADITSQRPIDAAEEPENWLTYAGTYNAWRYSPLDQINQGSHFDAYDPLTGEKRWSYKSKYPLLASAVATGGNLVFTGDPEGNFIAFDAESGKVLWTFNTGSGHRGSPITYAVDGVQYIAVPAGWGSAVAGLLPQLWPETEDFPGGSALFVFALK